MFPAAFEQFAVSVTAWVNAGAEGDAPIEQPNVPPDVLQVSVLPSKVKLEQEGALMVTVAACNGDDEGTARRTRVNAAAASAHAAGRTSDRFIFDSQAERRSGGPMAPASSAPAIAMKTINYTSCPKHPPTENRFRSSDLDRRPTMTLA